MLASILKGIGKNPFWIERRRIFREQNLNMKVVTNFIAHYQFLYNGLIVFLLNGGLVKIIFHLSLMINCHLFTLYKIMLKVYRPTIIAVKIY